MTGALVVVIGDVMNDVIVRPLGPVAPGTDTPSRIVHTPGGSGANQAAWLASMGVEVRFLARVGTADAARHREALAASGVDPWLLDDPVQPTGTVVAFVGPDGERSMFTDRGSNIPVAAVDLDTGVLDGARLLHVSAYQLFDDATWAALRPLWSAAAHAGIARSVDPASVAGLRDLGAAGFLERTAGAELLLPNRDEGRFLTGLSGPAAIVEQLCEHYPLVALKLGPAGAVVGARGKDPIWRPALPAEVVDTTGAGDAFGAGFVARWVAGQPLTDCLDGALACAAGAVAHPGARPAPPAMLDDCPGAP